MKRYYRTYKIKGRGKELLASVQADNEDDAEIEFLDKYYDTNYPNIFWTSPIFEKNIDEVEDGNSKIIVLG